MGTVQRRAGVQKHPLRSRRNSCQRRAVRAVIATDRYEKHSSGHKQGSSEPVEDEEAVLARLMPSTWQSKSVCDAAANAEGRAPGELPAMSSQDTSEHTFMISLQRHIQVGVRVVDEKLLAMAPDDHPMRPSKNFLVVLARRLFPRKRAISAVKAVPLPELRWSAAARKQRNAATQVVPEAQASSNFSGGEPANSQKGRHRGFQPAALSANRSKSPFRRVDAGFTTSRSLYSVLQPATSPAAAGATAHIEATLNRSLAAAARTAAPTEDTDLAATISAVYHTLAPAAPAATSPSSPPRDPWHQPARSSGAGLAGAPPAVPLSPPATSHSAVEGLPRSELEAWNTGLGAVDTLRTRLNRPAQPFPAQCEIDDTPPLPGMRPRSQLIYDEHKEAHRSWRRYVYDFDYWANDRSAARFFFAMLHVPATRILRDVLGPTLLVAAIAAVRCTPAASAVVAAAAAHLAAALPAAVWAAAGALASVISGTPIELTAGFVGLLVAFRANNAATRFDEARKQLATMLNATRDAVRLAIATLPSGAVQAKASFARWVIVSFAALQCQLRIDDDLEAEVSGLLTDAEQQLLFTSDHPTLMCFAVLARMIENAEAPQPQKRQLQRSVTRMMDVLGGCERIMDTPIPLTTMRHSARTLMIWLALFPVCMYPALGSHVLWVAPFAALLLFGMEEISVEIEEPFSMLPIEVITAKARSDIVMLVNNLHASDCATDTVVGNAMSGVPVARLNSMERPVEFELEKPSGWLKPSWATID